MTKGVLRDHLSTVQGRVKTAGQKQKNVIDSSKEIQAKKIKTKQPLKNGLSSYIDVAKIAVSNETKQVHDIISVLKMKPRRQSKKNLQKLSSRAKKL